MFTAQASVLLASAVALALAAATACGSSESSDTGWQGWQRAQPEPSGGAVSSEEQEIRVWPQTRRFGPFAIDAAVEGGLNPDAFAPDGARPAWCNAISNQGQCAWSH
jgi:hypothetical protein